jgi:flagellar protein FlgJ
MSSAAAFISTVAPTAVRLRLEGSPIFPSVRIAQAGLETGWKIPSWNNLGGYKAGSGKLTPYWRGKIVNKRTWEVYDGKRVDVTAAFRVYDSVEDFFRDQDLLFQLPRYARVRSAKTPEEQADALYACGYATDPQYGQKIKNIIYLHDLKRFDREVEYVLETLHKRIENLAEENKRLKERVETLEKLQNMPGIPEWAKEAVDAFTKSQAVDGSGPLVASPEGGSYDFYRFVTILYRAGIGREK